MVGMESNLRSPGQPCLYQPTTTPLLRRIGRSLWIDGAALLAWILWNYPYLSQFPSSPYPQLAQARYWRIAGRSDWTGAATGVGDGLRLGTGQHGYGFTIAAVMGNSSAALCQNPHHRIIDWFWRLWG